MRNTARVVRLADRLPATGMAAEADELGRIDEQLAVLKPVFDRQAELKKILAGYGVPCIEGTEFVCNVSTATENRLDTKAIRADMGADWCNAYSAASTKRTVRTARRPPASDRA